MKRSLLGAVVSRAPMPGARHPKPYNDGDRRPITIPWKRRVIAKLADNEKNGIEPKNINQLRLLLKAPKGGMNKMLDLERDPPQMTGTYVDEISERLDIAPPLVETDEDDENFARDVHVLRQLAPEARRELIALASRMASKRR